MTHYQASLFGAALGDTIGYKNGDWEFCKDTHKILDECHQLGGILKLPLHQWRVSDDTVMHLATIEAMIEFHRMHHKIKDRLFDEPDARSAFCERYVDALKDMKGRAPGRATINAKSSMVLREYANYDGRSGGNGAAMRTMAVGLFLPHKYQKGAMINMAIVASLVTHHHPVAVMGGIVSALFASYAIKKLSVDDWPFLFLNQDLPVIRECLNDFGLVDQWAAHGDSIDYFVDMWIMYVHDRFKTNQPVDNHPSSLCFTKPTWSSTWLEDACERDDFATRYQYSDWYGSSGHDAVILAYDALLFVEQHSCKEVGVDQKPTYASFVQLMTLAALNQGDSDSIASIAGAWFGAVHGMRALPNHHVHVEYYDRIHTLAKKLASISKDVASW